MCVVYFEKEGNKKNKFYLQKLRMPCVIILPRDSRCNRKYNDFCTEDCLKQIKDGKLQCKCGEDYPVLDWRWQSDISSNIIFSNDFKDVLFHPIYSSGTAAVKGTAPFGQNLHHYWEVKMISRLYGTDVMVGVATSKLDYESWKFSFCSMLGIDANSYGYSYMGLIQHDKMKRRYGSKYGFGSVIGVHLDMWNGTLEYFLNRKPLGIAFRDLKNMDLYPIVSSTAAQSAIRVTCSLSREPTLQIMCLKTVVNHPELYKQYRKISGLTRIYDREYFWIKPHEEELNEIKRLADLEEEVTLSLAKTRQNKKSRRSWVPVLCSDSEDNTSSDEEIPRKTFKNESEELETTDYSEIYENIFDSSSQDDLDSLSGGSQETFTSTDEGENIEDRNDQKDVRRTGVTQNNTESDS